MTMKRFNDKGYELLFSRYRVISVGILGLSCLIYALRDGKKIDYLLSSYLSEEGGRRREGKKKVKVIAGLMNLGNNCFLNVILQALASCECFISFLNEKVEEESFGEQIDRMPLTMTLITLLEELCATHDMRKVLNPRKVMAAMDEYIPSFQLASQQDAAEAFLHLFSSLKDEISGSYVPDHGSLLDIIAFRQYRIFTQKMEGCIELERWQQDILGPLDGIICSSLKCKSCSSEISTDFEFFHSLPLSLILDSSKTFVNQCSVEECLKKFTATELLENYRCNHCWHLKAIKYLSAIGGDETHIVKIKSCAEKDTCDCRKVFPRERMPWSNDFSRTTKQFCISRSPKILCIHLQRASVNMFGELVKLQGHVSFPLILDLFPFTRDAVGNESESMSEHVTSMYLKQGKQWGSRLDRELLQHTYGPGNKTISSDVLVGYDSELLLSNSNSSSEFTDVSSKIKVSESSRLVSSKSHKYRLVSVVEHFGKVGSGHYAVYRRVGDESDGEVFAERFDPEHGNWFCASDANVSSVSQEHVLSAEASLLFYEIIEGRL